MSQEVSGLSNATNKSTSEKIFQVFAWILFVTIILLCLIPLLHIVSTSFSSKDAVLTGQVGIFPVGFNTDAYGKVFSNYSFISSFRFSVILMFVFTFFAMFLTVLAAYPLSKRFLPGVGVIMTIFVITMYFDPGTIPNYLNLRDLKLLDSPLALLLPGALSAYNLIILRSFFRSIDNSLYEAANIDGCSEWRSLFSIAIPLAKPAIATLSLFYAVSRWNGVSDVMYYITKPEYMTVQVRLKQFMDTIVISQEERINTGIQIVQENVKAASVVFSMLPMLLAYPFVQRYFTQGIMIGAVKG